MTPSTRLRDSPSTEPVPVWVFPRPTLELALVEDVKPVLLVPTVTFDIEALEVLVIRVSEAVLRSEAALVPVVEALFDAAVDVLSL